MADQMPPKHTHNTHSLTAANHAHTYNVRGDFAGSTSRASSGDNGGGGPEGNPSTSSIGPLAVSGTIGSGLPAASTSIKPRYYALAYIMKL
jgi:hypothetical protein